MHSRDTHRIENLPQSVSTPKEPCCTRLQAESGLGSHLLSSHQNPEKFTLNSEFSLVGKSQSPRKGENRFASPEIVLRALKDNQSPSIANLKKQSKYLDARILGRARASPKISVPLFADEFEIEVESNFKTDQSNKTGSSKAYQDGKAGLTPLKTCHQKLNIENRSELRAKMLHKDVYLSDSRPVIAGGAAHTHLTRIR